MRTYQLIKITGWTLEQIDDAPADVLDWLLQIDAAFEDRRAEVRALEREQMLGGGRWR